MAYENIAKAVGRTTTNPRLTPSQEVDNYNAFSELQKQGIYLPDLVKKLSQFDDMKRRLDEMDERKSKADADLFAVMEQAVRNAPSVKEARQRVSVERSRIIERLCSEDAEYRNAVEDYRREVNAEYIRQKEPQEPAQKPV